MAAHFIGNTLKFIFSKRKIILLLIISSVIILFLTFSEFGILKRIELNEQKKAITQKIEIEKRLGDSLKHEINKVKTDETEIERIARESYGMIKPKEKIFIIKNKKDK